MSKAKTPTKITMRIMHRYLGYFLSGIMVFYAVSGTVLIYRDDDTFKVDKLVEKTIEANLSPEAIGATLKMRDFAVTRVEGDLVYFETGQYNTSTGEASYTVRALPSFLNRITELHKATTDDPFFWLNNLFAICLAFFVLSSFWMFKPKTKIFRRGLLVALGGFVFALIWIFW
ncbi:hypothetical protein HQ496_03190 [bacterium]|nr:hypothetical protein [bacterium]